MKKMTKFFALALLAGAMVSCSTEDTAPSHQNGKVAVQFTGGISVNTRASGTTWDNGDRIGITDIGNDTQYGNVPFILKNGKFEAEGKVIYIEDTKTHTFRAYYPYNAAGGILTATTDATAQQNQPAIDFLFASGATGDKNSPVVSFTDKTAKGGEDNSFHHRMSQITLTFEAGDGVNFSVVKPERYTLDGLLLTGTFNTADGIATADNGAQTGELTMNLADGNLTSSIILFPQTVASLPLVVNYKGQEYHATLTMPEGALQAGNNYTYTVKVRNKVLEVSEATGWTVIDEFAARFVYFYSGYLFANYVFALADRAREKPSAALLGLAACTQDELADDNRLPEGEYPVFIRATGLSVEATPQAAPSTRATVDGDWQGVTSVALKMGDAVKEYTVTASTDFKSATLSRENDPHYWTSRDPITVSAWWPFNNADITQMPAVKVAEDQSKLADFQNSDFISAENQTVEFDDPTLEFTHRTARVAIELKPGTGFTSVAGATVSLVSLSADNGNPTAIKTYNASGNTYEALTAPQTVAAGKPFVKVELGGGTFYFRPQNNVVLAAGSRYKYTVKVNATGLTLEGCTIGSWVDGGGESGAAEDLGYIYDSNTNTYTVYNACWHGTKPYKKMNR